MKFKKKRKTIQNMNKKMAISTIHLSRIDSKKQNKQKRNRIISTENVLMFVRREGN